MSKVDSYIDDMGKDRREGEIAGVCVLSQVAQRTVLSSIAKTCYFLRGAWYPPSYTRS